MYSLRSSCEYTIMLIMSDMRALAPSARYRQGIHAAVCEALDRAIACITGLDQGKYEMYTQHAEDTDKMPFRR